MSYCIDLFFSKRFPIQWQRRNLLNITSFKDRLEKELRVNVALRVEPTSSPESFKVSGRGQLHLGVLVENMRREALNCNFQRLKLFTKRLMALKCEPIERVLLDIPTESQGVVMENMGRRKAQMINMVTFDDGRMRLEYELPSRALLGFRSQFLTDTRGNGIMNFSFAGYQPYKGDITTRIKGAMVSMEQGEVTGFALDNLQDRGILFVRPGDEVYEGMIIGENSREGDMDVNPCKEKKLTNMRALVPMKLLSSLRHVLWN